MQMMTAWNVFNQIFMCFHELCLILRRQKDTKPGKFNRM